MAPELAVDREITRDEEGYAETMLAAVSFRVDVARERGAVRVSPVGEIDLVTIGPVRERLDEAMAAAPGRVILDLRETTFVDSSALHLAVEAYEQAVGSGIGFAIVAGPPGVQRTFEITGLTDRLPFVDVPHG